MSHSSGGWRAPAADGLGRGLHGLGEEVAWSLRSEQAYALPPGAEGEPAPIDPEAAALDDASTRFVVLSGHSGE